MLALFRSYAGCGCCLLFRWCAPSRVSAVSGGAAGAMNCVDCSLQHANDINENVIIIPLAHCLSLAVSLSMRHVGCKVDVLWVLLACVRTRHHKFQALLVCTYASAFFCRIWHSLFWRRPRRHTHTHTSIPRDIVAMACAYTCMHYYYCFAILLLFISHKTKQLCGSVDEGTLTQKSILDNMLLFGMHHPHTTPHIVGIWHGMPWWRWRCTHKLLELACNPR